MKLLYIGQYTEGTTSKMRANTISEIFPSASFKIIDTHIPFHVTNRLIRSIGVRYKKGGLISNINNFIFESVKRQSIDDKYDLIWVDKGVFITKKTLKCLRSRTKTLMHYTPDMAFYANKSSYFIKNMDLYDFVITTKSPEIDLYKKHVDAEKIILVSQGFDSKIHKPYNTFEEKENYISFIGLYEKHRGAIIQKIINSKIRVKVAGKRWEDFVSKNESNPYLSFSGNALYSQEYSKFISKSILSLGLISKNFPELHTTRTFEIPACGTAILTERNKEISTFYKENEVIFFDTQEDLIEKIKYFFENTKELKEITEAGKNRVTDSGFDYKTILSNILKKASLL